MTFKEKLDAKLKELEALNVKLQEGDMEAAAKSAEVRAEIDKLNEAIKAAQDVEEKLKALGTSKVGKSGEAKVSEKAARSLGENFVNNLKAAKLGERFVMRLTLTASPLVQTRSTPESLRLRE